MTIIWPEAIKKLRAQSQHWTRRLKRMELLALGGRVDWAKFPERRAYLEGMTDAYLEALMLIDLSTVNRSIPLDPAIITLAQNGLDVEAIANRCGVSVEEVAATLVRYVQMEGDD